MKNSVRCSIACARAVLPAALLALAWARPASCAEVTGRKVARLNIGFVEPDAMAVSPDGRWISIRHIPGEKGSDCSILERRTHRLTTLAGASRLEPIAFTRDGRSLIVWGYNAYEPLPGMRQKPPQDFFLALYDLRRRRFTRTITDARHDMGVVSRASLSRGGRTLFFANNDGWLGAWSLRSGRLRFRRRLIDTGGEPATIPLSPDGSRWMRIEDRERGGRIGHLSQVVSACSGRVLSSLWMPYPKAQSMMSAHTDGAISPNNRLAASFFPATQEWFFWSTRSGRRQWKMGAPSSASEGDLGWRFSPDGRFVGVSGPRGFELRRASSGRVLARARQMRGASALAFSPDGSLLYSIQEGSGFEGQAVLWQWRLHGSQKQRRADRRVAARMRRAENRFAWSARHINESLIQAARQGDPARVADLLRRGANIQARDRFGGTPLNIAAWGNDVYGGPQQFEATVRLLLARGAQVNTRTLQRDTPLTSATGSYRISKLLIEHGAQVNASTFEGRTALHSAAAFRRVETARLLLAHGAQVNARTHEGRTPLMELAAFVQGDDPPTTMRNATTLARLLLARGADVNARGTDGRTSVSLTSSAAFARVLQQLGGRR